MVDYNTDFYGWTQEQAALLRSGRLNEIDIENLIEEVETMGRSEKRALQSRLVVLLTHLLKWRYQAERRGSSWRLTIDHQRIKFLELLSENPGLKHDLDKIFTSAYLDATYQAAKETALPLETFPVAPPWLLTQSLQKGFYPE
jgi:hypothetical protein